MIGHDHAVSPPAKNRGAARVPEFDGLRGALAWFVVFVHVLICCGWFGPRSGGIPILSQFAESALNVYILLSGFAITRLLAVRQEPFGRYIWRRICRIVPAYWIALAAAISLNGWLASNLRHLPPTPDSEGLIAICNLAAARFWTDTVLHVFLVHGLAPAQLLPFAAYTFLGVAWSLSLEWQFYCVAPSAFAAVKNSRVALAVLIVVGAVGLATARSSLHFVSEAFLLVKGGFILAGALTYAAVVRDYRSSQRMARLLAPAFVAAVLWGYGSGRAIEAAVTLTAWSTVVVAAFGTTLQPVSRALNSNPLQYLGRVSYSTYLFHVPVITIAQAAIWRWINPRQSVQLFVWTSFAAVLGTLTVSELSWRFVERPFQRLGREKRL